MKKQTILIIFALIILFAVGTIFDIIAEKNLPAPFQRDFKFRLGYYIGRNLVEIGLVIMGIILGILYMKWKENKK